MMANKLYASVTNTSDIYQVRFTEAHNDSAPMCVIDAETSSLSIGDSVTADIGYVGDHAQVFSGYVKSITKNTPPTLKKITAYGEMIRAVDYFMASNDPYSPFSRSNIAAEDLVEDIMAEAGLTNYGYDATSFTFGVQGPVEVNLTAAYDFCNMIANTLAWHLYADQNGKVWFVDRKPYVMGGDSPSATLTVSNIISASYLESERDLRNRIVVYGFEGIHATASASSPYLPSGFYKSVVASAYWIDTQSMAQLAADHNLTLLNRLTKEGNMLIVGNADLQARDIVTVTEANTGMSGNWYIYGIEHMWSKNGFTTALTVRQ
jgi:hypothetical protein